MDENYWANRVLPEQVLAPGAEPVADAVGRLQGLLDLRAPAFAESRFGLQEGIDLRAGRRGLLADEAVSFLRALDAGLLVLDDIGGVRIEGCRPKPGGGRYQLFSANRYAGDRYVSLNLEYLIQFGASCELVAFYGWSADEVEVEIGEFDVLAHSSDRVVLAMEAKARIEGPDSLTDLWRSFIRFASSDVPPTPFDNHSRKYAELLRLAGDGPVVLWLVAAQARWVALATHVDSHIEFEPFPTVEHSQVLDAVTQGHVRGANREVTLTPDLSHAIAVARMTELDGQQRCYEFPWQHERDFDAFLAELRDEARCDGLTRTRPWKWRADTSGGQTLSPSGRATGLELRVSYYAG